MFGGNQMIGSSVGNYKITEKIGEGGMGAVFKGIDEMLEREVAIKMLRPELARQPDVVERFRSEAVTLAKLNHPNIATLYSFMRHGEDYFMVMEYVRGNTLEAIIKNFGAISYERAIPLFCQALEGIDHAHKQGIVHRDIKPANVMILDSGSVKVMDFGIARVLGSARLTRQGNVVGTVEYMSPEQIKGEESDARSDIYSLGMLLYEMLTGRLPFESKSEYELMRLQVEEAPPPPTLHSANIPQPMEQAIMRALAKKREARFESAGEMRAVLLRSLVASTSQLGNSSTGNYAAPATRVMNDSGNISASGERQVGQPARPAPDSTNPSKETVVDRNSASFAVPSVAGDIQTTQVLGADGQPVHQAGMPAAQIRGVGSQPEATRVIGGQPEARPLDAATRVVSFQPPLIPQPPSAGKPPAPVAQKAAAVSTTSGSKMNLKMVAGVGVIILVLAGGSAAYFLRKGNTQPTPPVVVEPQAENPEAANPDPQSQQPAQSENQAATPPTDPNSPLEENANANSNTAKQSKSRKGEKTEQPTEPTDEAKKEEPAQPSTTQPTQQPTTQQPAHEPKQEPTPAVAKEPEKKEEKKDEKKKGGGVGGFFKKIFGGGEKKKDEKKPQN
jgi:serine/threonine-protein kinase